MSLLTTTTKQILRRPFPLAVVTVGIAFVLSYQNSSTDPSEHPKPVASSRNMHIQSIPMCECSLMVPPSCPTDIYNRGGFWQQLRLSRHG